MKHTPQKKKYGAKKLTTLSITTGMVSLAVFGMMAVLVCAAFLWGMGFSPSLSKKDQATAQYIANFSAKQVDNLLLQSDQIVKAHWSMPDTTNLSSQDLQDKLNMQLKQALPGTLGVWVFDSLKAIERATQDPLIGFAALEMMQNAWKQGDVPAEVHRVQNDKTVLMRAKRIGDSHYKLVLIAQDIEVYHNQLATYLQGQGGFALKHTRGGQGYQFATVGQFEQTNGITAYSSLQQLPWQLSYSTATTPSEFGLTQFLFITLPFIAVLFVLSGLIVRAYRKWFSQDISLLRESITSLAANKTYSVPWFTIKELNQYDWSYEFMAKEATFEATKVEEHTLEPPAVEEILKPGDAVMQESFDVEELELNIPQNAVSDEKVFEPIEIGTLAPADVPMEIFRACDIRGKMGHTLSKEIAYLIGLSFASEAKAQRQTKVVVGYDGRHSSPDLAKALMQGLMAAGQDVVNIGLVPTPVLYFATHHCQTGTGIMITGSHNPKDYNGFKMMLAGATLAQEQITQLYDRIQEQNFSLGEGEYTEQDMLTPYVEAVTERTNLQRSLKVVIDCGNGAAGTLAERLFTTLGCDVVPLYCDVDGDFPNHHPDPGQPQNLSDLIQCVTAMQADIGIAFDGDGDRLGVVTNAGEIIWPDRLMMLFAKDCLSRNPGANIIFDVKCTKHLAAVITEAGGQPIMYKTGHALIKKKMIETNALLAGEMSGHFFFNENWFGFDDGSFAAAKLLSIISQQDEGVAQLCEALPNSVNTPEINVAIDEDKKFSLIEQLQNQHGFGSANIITVDGLRAEFEDGWGLVRASNTTPCLVLRFEADNESALNRIKGDFKTSLKAIAPDLDTGF